MALGSNTKFYETPNHPYQGERINEESGLLDRYGLKNKEELWRTQSTLRSFRREARSLLGQTEPDAAAQRARDQFLARLRRIGLMGEDDGLGDVLALEVTDILERRLQTVAYRQGLGNTADQARQFIVHGHVTVRDARVTRPGYTVDTAEEDHIEFDESSPLADDLHPERAGEQE